MSGSRGISVDGIFTGPVFRSYRWNSTSPVAPSMDGTCVFGMSPPVTATTTGPDTVNPDAVAIDGNRGVMRTVPSTRVGEASPSARPMIEAG